MLVTLGARQSYTLYTPAFDGLPAGFQVSAIIEVTGGDGAVDKVCEITHEAE